MQIISKTEINKDNFKQTIEKEFNFIEDLTGKLKFRFIKTDESLKDVARSYYVHLSGSIQPTITLSEFEKSMENVE